MKHLLVLSLLLAFSVPRGPDVLRVRVPVDGAPAWGGKRPKVVLVEFADFQCPYSKREAEVVLALQKKYGADLKVVWRDYPLPFHPGARLAAAYARAAGEQGKFWEMHDLIWSAGWQLDDEVLLGFAGELGLDLARVKAAVASGKYAKAIDSDLDLALKVGANGTPTFFVNGRPVLGAAQQQAFEAIIDEEIRTADRLLARGVPRERLVDAITRGALERIPPPPSPDRPDPALVEKIDPGDGPAMGPADAKVTIIEFADFQCPFCARVPPTIARIFKEYAGKVRLVWRNAPMPFHENAMPAARAAMAAHAQGKFWPMHDTLVEHSRELTSAALVKYAGEVGLDARRFAADFEDPKIAAKIEEERRYAEKLKLGTPTFFINGHRVAGAQPFEAFAPLIDAELKK